METYLQQLEARAGEIGFSLDDVCLAAGVAATTLARWRKGQNACHKDTRDKLLARMEKMRTKPALKKAS